MVQFKQSVGSLEINIEMVGYGPHIILCLPGALGFIEADFGPLLEKFDPSKYTVIVWDPPGYGKSRPPHRDFSIGAEMYEKDADCAATLMENLGFNKYSLLGWNDGAATACYIAACYPNAVNYLIIWGGRAEIKQEDLDRNKDFVNIDNISKDVLEPHLIMYGEEYLRKSWTALNKMYEEIVRDGGYICFDMLEFIFCSTLVLHGENDTTITLDNAQYFHEHIAFSEFIVVAGANHDLHLKFPDTFISKIERFFEEN
ncbi:unnamed protein product [Orchesella dallaii]|uniref:AB hydrolase-1 domain-containing protein n=1 Tax=Orchesella dallaii TaxID=48710 RepID=A0ABP1QQW2_9HEXA